MYLILQQADGKASFKENVFTDWIQIYRSEYVGRFDVGYQRMLHKIEKPVLISS